MRMFLLTLAVGCCLLTSGRAMATLGHQEDFEDASWVANMTNNWQNSGGTITRVASGNNGITSANGSTGHAVLSTASVGVGGPAYSWLGWPGGPSSFGTGFAVSQDIYLTPGAWADGTGFDFDAAASNQSGGFLRDFIFHVGKVGNDLIVNANNNASNPGYNSGVLLGGHNYTVTNDGWYNFEQVFHDNGSGILAVDFNLYDDSDALLYTVTRSDINDDITTVGGNPYYAWFDYNTVGDLAIDNTKVTALAPPVPEPATAGLLALGVVAIAARRRRRA